MKRLREEKGSERHRNPPGFGLHRELKTLSNKCNFLSLSLSSVPNKVVSIIGETPGEVLAL